MNIFGKFIKDATTTFIKNKPAIMTGIALVSLATTVFITAKEAPKIKAVADEKKENIDAINSNEEMSEDEKKSAIRDEVTDGLKEVTMPVIKVALAAGITAFAIFGINKAHTAREIAASALLESYKNQIVGYEEKIPALLGKQKAEELRHDVIVESAEKMSKEHGTNKEKFKTINYNDKVPMLDDYGNRWVGSKEDLDRAINEMEADKNFSHRERTIDYEDFLNEHFDCVEISEISHKLVLDPEYTARVETTVYDDNFLNTVGYLVHFTQGAPVERDDIDGKY